MNWEEKMEARDKVMKILEEKNCTVAEAQYILTQVSKMISATARVQFVDNCNYEF